MKNIRQILYGVLSVSIVLGGFLFVRGRFMENKVLKQVIERLQADSRVAEVLVTNVQYDENDKSLKTTIKFLEYDVKGHALTPKYFTFSGNIIQFQSLVIRFDDQHIRQADKLRNKSVYLFWKVFMLDGANTQEYDIATSAEVPGGYRVDAEASHYEKKVWARFWRYALDGKEASQEGIKNAQIEAPGTMFVPGMLYTIKIEHDGGLRIGSTPLPSILKGEKIPK